MNPQSAVSNLIKQMSYKTIKLLIFFLENSIYWKEKLILELITEK